MTEADTGAQQGSNLFIVDNSDTDATVHGYLHDWCQLSDRFDIATGNFEIGSLLGLDGEWQQVDKLRILMGGDVSFRTKQAFQQALDDIRRRLDNSIEAEKEANDFLSGVDSIVKAIKSKQIECRVYRKDRFHAKAYITHGRQKVIGSFALVGSSNFTCPGLHDNVELNVQVTGTSVNDLQDWYEEYWEEAEDVSLDVLAVIERQVQQFKPFDVWVRSLHELFRDAAISTHEWERLGPKEGGSMVFPQLDHYQQEGYWNLLETAERFGGAFLCDGVGLGKTFIGMMLLERLVIHDRQRVVLIVPKAARKDVWESTLKTYCPALMDGFMPFRIINHTDITRKASEDMDWPLVMNNIREQADAVVIDEAHHFRNRGSRYEDDPTRPPSRYWQLFDMLGGPQTAKKLFLLTATPINNRLSDFRHMLELFTRENNSHFAGTLGINSVPGHFNRLEKSLKKLQGSDVVETDLAEAEELLDKDKLFTELVVQRSRAYVIASQQQQGKDAAAFPKKKDPQVVKYSIRKTYGKLLDQFEKAFSKKSPLFALSIYYPLVHYKGNMEEFKGFAFANARQKQVIGLIRTQFLKRFESSVVAFESSCERLLLKLLTWAKAHAKDEHEVRKFAKWEARNEDVLGRSSAHQHDMWDPSPDAEIMDDLISPEMLEAVDELDSEEYHVDRILDDVLQDLNQLADFLKELAKFRPKNDDKLQALITLLKKDAVLKDNKCLIFTEFADTARYLKRELRAAGIEGVQSVDGSNTSDRGDIIHRFAPYYNGTSSAELIDRNRKEIRILISTDVLSEGLNLQDATRLINYDIHWNPVRLMQRIGRVDRRMNPAVEKHLLSAHPEQENLRGEVAYWNFLPPDELNHLLTLYKTVTNKTLRISKVFGIEGKKLLTPEDDYDALKDLYRLYEGDIAPLERLRLEYRDLIKDDAELEERLESQPLRVFSGREKIKAGSRAVFFCYALPARDASQENEQGEAPWTLEAGTVIWYLLDLESNDIQETAEEIAKYIRSEPNTTRKCVIDQTDLRAARLHIEKHINNTYMRQRNAPVGIRPQLQAWMELS